MKIALLAPFEEPVPPIRYGGTERVVYNLAEELVLLGHGVTLFASGGSQTSAKLVACLQKPVRTSSYAKNEKTRRAANLRALIKAISSIAKGQYDVVHNHFGWETFLFSDLIRPPMLTTIHGSLAEPIAHYMHSRYKKLPFVSISNSQRKHAPELNFISTVYNGINVSKYEFGAKPKDYLMFLGRIHPQKGPEYAIDIAKRTGKKLIIAAKVDPVDEDYFKSEVMPSIDNKQIIFIPEPTEPEKIKLLKQAYALIAPIQWDEPFGMVNIEALACGTPVVTIKRGSTPEIIISGKVGFLCKNSDEMIARLKDIPKLNRVDCRRHVEKHFSSHKMAKGYLEAYVSLIKYK